MDDFLKALANLSPAIGAALGGPVGAAIGVGVKGLAGAITGETDPDSIIEALGDPVKLRELENRTREIENDTLRIHAEDRNSARNLAARLAEAGSRLAWAPAIISTIVTSGFFGMLYAVLQVPIPDASRDAAYILLGALGAGFTQVLNYWLGSSKGSSDKSRILEGLAKR